MRDNLLLHIEPADLREIEIKHDHIRNLLVQQSECGKPVVRDLNLEPFHTQRTLEHLACPVVVFNEQNSAPVGIHVCYGDAAEQMHRSAAQCVTSCATQLPVNVRVIPRMSNGHARLGGMDDCRRAVGQPIVLGYLARWRS